MKQIEVLAVLFLAGCSKHSQGVGQKCKDSSDCKDGLACVQLACAEPTPTTAPQDRTVDAALSTVTVDRVRGIVADDEDAVTVSVRLSTTTYGIPVGVAVQPTTDDPKVDRFTPEIAAADEKGEVTFKLRSTKASIKTLTVKVGDFDQVALNQKPEVEFVAGSVDPTHIVVKSTDARADGKTKATVEVQLADKFDNLVALGGKKLDVTLPAGSALKFDTLSTSTNGKAEPSPHIKPKI